MGNCRHNLVVRLLGLRVSCNCRFICIIILIICLFLRSLVCVYFCALCRCITIVSICVLGRGETIRTSGEDPAEEKEENAKRGDC